MELNKIYQGNNLEVLKTFPDNSIDSFVTDPPYGLKFMGKHWDYDIPKVSVFEEMYRTIKPGGYILIACGTRTQHRMAVNIEDAGFEIRDVISWLYGSGFPKSLDISKAIDKQAGAQREQGSEKVSPDGIPMSKRTPNSKDGYHPSHNVMSGATKHNIYNSLPSTDAAKQWEGWGTALKPAQEFWTLARKPLSENTVAENVLKHGTGGINIDGCRIDLNGIDKTSGGCKGSTKGSTYVWSNGNAVSEDNSKGRFPSNVILDEFMGKELDKQTGILTSGGGDKGNKSDGIGMFKNGKEFNSEIFTQNEGGASRFFYCPKADNFQRNKGLKDFDKGEPPASARSKAAEGRENALGNPRANHHPTVKPIDLMRYLVKLITPKGGLTCDPFCGSGTTLIGAKLELINFIGIEREKEYCEISEARIEAWNPDKYKSQTLFK